MGKRGMFSALSVGEWKGEKHWNKREKENTNTYVTSLMIIIIIIIIVFAHVIVCQIGMIGLYTVVKYWDDYVFAGIPFLPSRTHIHVETVQSTTILK